MWSSVTSQCNTVKACDFHVTACILPVSAIKLLMLLWWLVEVINPPLCLPADFLNVQVKPAFRVFFFFFFTYKYLCMIMIGCAYLPITCYVNSACNGTKSVKWLYTSQLRSVCTMDSWEKLWSIKFFCHFLLFMISWTPKF